MTLATKLIVIEATPFRPIFDEARRLIGADQTALICFTIVAVTLS